LVQSELHRGVYHRLGHGHQRGRGVFQLGAMLGDAEGAVILDAEVKAVHRAGC
jgi:hypothetical protein